MQTIDKFSIKKELLDSLKIKEDDNKILEVGFFKDAKYENGLQVAQVAKWNEFGTVHIPPRPFFRNAYNDNIKKWYNFLFQSIRKGNSVEAAFKLVGEMSKGDIVKSITSLKDPPNAPSTIKRKMKQGKKRKRGKLAVANPLIDTGFMRASVNYQIVKKEK